MQRAGYALHAALIGDQGVVLQVTRVLGDARAMDLPLLCALATAALDRLDMALKQSDSTRCKRKWMRKKRATARTTTRTIWWIPRVCVMITPRRTATNYMSHITRRTASLPARVTGGHLGGEVVSLVPLVRAALRRLTARVSLSTIFPPGERDCSLWPSFSSDRGQAFTDYSSTCSATWCWMVYFYRRLLKQQKSRGGVALVMQATSSQCLTRCCTKVNASFTAWWAAEDQKWEPQREKEGIGALVSWS